MLCVTQRLHERICPHRNVTLSPLGNAKVDKDCAAETDFGQSDFGPLYLTDFWPIPTLAKPAPKGGGREGWGREGWGAQNFALFFPLSRSIFALFVSLLVSSRGILVVFSKAGPQMCTFGVLGLSCEAPAATNPPRVSHHSPRAQTCTFEGPGLHKNNQNSTRRPPERHKKERNGGGKGKKKREILGGPAEAGPAESKPTTTTTTTTTKQQRQQTQNNNTTATTTTQQQQPPSTTKFGQNTKTLKLAKVGLAKVGQHSETLKLAKVGLAKVGQAHDWPKSVKKLAKVGLAKVGLAKVGHDRLCPIREEDLFVEIKGSFCVETVDIGESHICHGTKVAGLAEALSGSCG